MITTWRDANPNTSSTTTTICHVPPGVGMMKKTMATAVATTVTTIMATCDTTLEPIRCVSPQTASAAARLGADTPTATTELVTTDAWPQ